MSTPLLALLALLFSYSLIVQQWNDLYAPDLFHILGGMDIMYIYLAHARGSKVVREHMLHALALAFVRTLLEIKLNQLRICFVVIFCVTIAIASTL